MEVFFYAFLDREPLLEQDDVIDEVLFKMSPAKYVTLRERLAQEKEIYFSPLSEEGKVSL